MAGKPRACTIDGCTHKTVARRLCHKHYQAAMKAGTLDQHAKLPPRVKNPKICPPVTAALKASDSVSSAALAAIEPYVDFFDVHFYFNVDSGNYGISPRLGVIPGIFPGKPFLISEAGGNLNNGTPPYLPHEASQAAAYARLRSYHTGIEGYAGTIFHKIADGNTSQSFGLYSAADETGVLRPAGQQAMQAPGARAVIVHDIVEHRLHPVVVDNFYRTPSATVVGPPPVGPAPTQRAGTWGISAAHRLYVATKSGGTDMLTWEANTGIARIEAEFVPGSICTAGIIFNYGDNNNRVSFYYDESVGGVVLSATQRLGGVSTQKILTGGYGSGFGSRVVGDLGPYVKLAVVTTGANVEFWMQGRMIQRIESLIDLTLAEKTSHGLMLGATDTGTVFTRVRISTPGVAWP